MPELIRLNIPFIVVLFLAAFSFALIYFFYRKTNPEISPVWKWILIVLRATVLFLILLLFLRPALQVFYYQKKYPAIDIFIDNSQSMSVRDGKIQRWQVVQRVLRIFEKNLDKPFRIHWFTFNSRLQPVSKTSAIKPSQGATNFAPVLKRLQKARPDLAFIVSDGVITEGGLPTDLELSTRTAVYCIPVGRVHAESDVFIRDAVFAPVAYKNQPQSLSVIIATKQWSHKQRAVLTLWNGKTLLAQKTIALAPGKGQMRVPLTYIPKRLGLQRLTIRLTGIKEDANPYNNVFRFVQNVLKSRIRLALLASAPNYDLKFFHFLLQKNPKFDVQWLVEDNKGRFLQKIQWNWLDSSDVWIFAEYPGIRSSATVLQRLHSVWNKRHPSLALMLGSHTDWSTLNRLINDLPFSPISTRSPKEIQVNAIVEENINTNTFINLFSDHSLTQSFWNRIPPVNNSYPQLKFKTKHTTLLTAAHNGRLFPLVFLQEQPAYKLLVFNGSGFWRWHFLLQNDPEVSDGYGLFLNKLIRWLAYKQSFKPVRITVNRKSGHIGQSFELTIRITDARFKPISNGSILLKAHLGKQSFDLSAQESEPGIFKARFVPPTAGTYRLQVVGFQQDKMLGRDSLQIAVVPVDKEFIHLSPDTLFLKRLSAESGGKLLRISQLKSFLQNNLNRPQHVLKEKHLELWYRPEWLILIILLISVEWALRKKLNLV